MNPQLIFPTQLERFIKKVNKYPSQLNDRYSKMAENLLSQHIVESPYVRSPSYSYEKLAKGLFCPKCFSLIFFKGKLVVCHTCGFEEGLEAAVLRCVNEIKLLFPNLPITTKVVQEWCKIESEKTVRRILIKNFKLIQQGRSSYYVPILT